MIRVNPGELWSFCRFLKVPENPSQVEKGQKAHISLKWRLIQKIKALYFLQLKKMKKKYVVFLAPTLEELYIFNSPSLTN